MAGKYVVFDLSDNGMKNLADALANKTCRKILAVLAEQESSESDISKMLNMPLNTVHYDMQKLVKAGLAEKTTTHFWSAKGKKIAIYRASKRTILISPKQKSKLPMQVFLTALGIGIAAFAIQQYQFISSGALKSAEESAIKSVMDAAAPAVSQAAETSTGVFSQTFVWLWFLAGGLSALLIFLLLSWKLRDS
jgi:DNA-binding transcriptional ArsR family regulator